VQGLFPGLRTAIPPSKYTDGVDFNSDCFQRGSRLLSNGCSNTRKPNAPFPPPLAVRKPTSLLSSTLAVNRSPPPQVDKSKLNLPRWEHQLNNTILLPFYSAFPTTLHRIVPRIHCGSQNKSLHWFKTTGTSGYLPPGGFLHLPGGDGTTNTSYPTHYTETCLSLDTTQLDWSHLNVETAF
jgi:hypothetical protein